jgi:hypothetical protein
LAQPGLLGAARSLLCGAACALLAGCLSTGRPITDRAAATGAFKELSFAILADYDEGADLNEVADDFRAMRELGITTWRGRFAWADLEPEPGAYDFVWLFRFVRLAWQHGIALRPYLASTPEWAGGGGRDADPRNDPPAPLAAWEAFLAHLGSALRAEPNVLSYEIYPEENIPQGWDGSLADYVGVLRAARSALHAAHPEAGVLLGGLAGPDAAWVEGVCAAAADAFDVVAFHAYPETRTREAVTVERYLDEGYPAFLDAARRCGGKPVWINETGFATVPGTTERDQAGWWARAIASFAAAPGVTHLGIAAIRDQPADRPEIADEADRHLGLLRSNRTPKLAHAMVRTLVALMSGSVRVDDGAVEVTGPPVRRHLFTHPDGRRILFVWNEVDRPATVDVRLDRPFGAAREHRLDGRVGAVAAAAPGALRITVTREPTILELLPAR